MAKGGKQPGAGRPKGSVSKITKDLREAVIQSFDDVGGVEYLVKMAKEQPQSYLALLGKILPKEVNLNVREKSLERLCEKLDSSDLDQFINDLRTLSVTEKTGKGEAETLTIQ